MVRFMPKLNEFQKSLKEEFESVKMPRMTKQVKKEQDELETDYDKAIKYISEATRKWEDDIIQGLKVSSCPVKQDDSEDLSFYRTCAHCGNQEGILRSTGHPAYKSVICKDCWGK